MEVVAKQGRVFGGLRSGRAANALVTFSISDLLLKHPPAGMSPVAVFL